MSYTPFFSPADIVLYTHDGIPVYFVITRMPQTWNEVVLFV